MEDIKMSAMKAQYARFKPELDAAFTSVMDSGAFGGGAQVSRFATALGQYLQVRHVIPCASGTEAFRLVFAALELPQGAEVIIPAFSDVAAMVALRQAGLTPVFADVLPETYTLDHASVQKLITPNTKALIPVHLFGQCAPMAALLELAAAHNLFVIEDSTHSLGAMYTTLDKHTARAGGMGHLNVTSFFPPKPFAGSGEGAAILTNDPLLAQRVQTLTGSYASAGMDALQAAMLEVKLKYVDEFNAARQEIASFYDRAFAITNLMQAPHQASYSSHIYQQYAIIVAPAFRDGLKKHLSQHHVPSEVPYPQPLHQVYADANLQHDIGSLPVSERLSRSILSLPMHGSLSEEQLRYICQHVLDYVQQQVH